MQTWRKMFNTKRVIIPTNTVLDIIGTVVSVRVLGRDSENRPSGVVVYSAILFDGEQCVNENSRVEVEAITDTEDFARALDSLRCGTYLQYKGTIYRARGKFIVMNMTFDRPVKIDW